MKDQNPTRLITLQQTLEKIERRVAAGELHGGRAHSYFQDEFLMHGGLETVTHEAGYSWEGTKRGIYLNHPFFVWQYTLDGWGCYADETGVRKMLPGMSFMAIIPTAHHYYLPPESASWTFFFVMARHSFVVPRLVSCNAQSGPVQSFAPQSPLITRALSLYEGIRLMSFRDRFASEQAMIEFLLEYERACYSSPQSDALMEDVRRRVLRHAGLGVEELADERGMSRSNYSHYFKATTGVSPALFMRQVRLEESARRLLQTDQKLEHIARETGFANANHFCKAFRQRYHLSPGEFRRQLR